MIALCTGKPKIAIEGERIILSIPSGRGRVQASLSLNQLLELRRSTIHVIDEAFDAFANPANAVVLPFAQARDA